MANASTWKKLVDGTYKGFTFHVAVPGKTTGQGITRQETTLKARNQVIRRPAVNGAKVVNMGLDPEEYTVEVCFFGDSWSDLYDQFKAVLVDPSPGKLVLPTRSKAVTAMFDHMSELAQVGDGNSYTCTVTWIQNETTDQSSGLVGSGANPLAGTSLGTLAAAASATTSALASAQSAVQSAVNAANSVIQASGILQAINAEQAALSTVKRFSNTVLALTQGVKNRIIQIQANISSTMALAEKAIDAITGGGPSSAAVAQAAVQAAVATSSTGAISTPSIDADTGQLIITNTQDSTVSPPPNPLTPPPVQPDTGIVIGDLTSDVAKLALMNQIVTLLQEQSAEMNGYLNGATSDVSDAMTPVITALQNFMAAATSTTTVEILTEVELSLAEIMFYNGLGLDQLLAIHQQNPQILDPAVVPSGTVVSL